jgi:hypothetical protein
MALKFTNHSIDSAGDEVCRWREIIETREGFFTVVTVEWGETIQEDDVPTARALGMVKDWDKADETPAEAKLYVDAVAYIDRFVAFLHRYDNQI